MDTLRTLDIFANYRHLATCLSNPLLLTLHPMLQKPNLIPVPPWSTLDRVSNRSALLQAPLWPTLPRSTPRTRGHRTPRCAPTDFPAAASFHNPPCLPAHNPLLITHCSSHPSYSHLLSVGLTTTRHGQLTLTLTHSCLCSHRSPSSTRRYPSATPPVPAVPPPQGPSFPPSSEAQLLLLSLCLFSPLSC